MTDPIADMLARLRNALQRKHETVAMPLSKTKLEIAEILKQEGYVSGFTFEDKDGKGTLNITLKYVAGNSVILGLRRLSTPGKRSYSKSKNVPRVLDGMGIVIISTSQGVMPGYKAKKLGIGGELLCKVW